jgi:hypothetical protein
MPEVRQIALPEDGAMGVAVEGSEAAWPVAEKLRLPELDRFSTMQPYIEVFNRGQRPFRFTARTDASWLVLSQPEGEVDRAQRIDVHVRWEAVPPGAKSANVVVEGPDGARTIVEVPVNRASLAARKVSGFVETGGVVAIEAEHYARELAAAGRQWLRVPGLGRTLSGMTTLPVDAAPATLADAMRLEYEVYLFRAGKVKVQATLAPTLKFRPGSGFRYAISFDDEDPQVVDVHQDSSQQRWEKNVSDGVTQLVSEHVLARPGAHTLKFWALDSGLVLQRLVIDAGGLQPSYLGPPESRNMP